MEHIRARCPQCAKGEPCLMVDSTDKLVAVAKPATGRLVRGTETVMADRIINLAGDEKRRTFVTTDLGFTYRLAQITVYADGTYYAWACQLTKKGEPYQNGMGLNLGPDVFRGIGQDLADVIAEAIKMTEHPADVPNIPANGKTRTSPFLVDLVEGDRPIQITTVGNGAIALEIKTDMDLVSAEIFAKSILNYVMAAR